MTQRGSTPLTAAPPNGADPARRRVVAPRRSLPGTRSAVGALLVTASAVGLFAAYDAARRGPAASYVVLAADIRPGQVLRPSDLALVAIDLPAAQRAVSFTEPGRLVGTVSLGRMRKGQLVQSADVAAPAAAGELAQISVAVEPGNAMDGNTAFLKGGERVDVIATYTQGGAPVTRTVAVDALVVDVLTGERQLGGDGRLTVVLAVPPDDLEPIAGAAATATISLARTTGLRR